MTRAFEKSDEDTYSRLLAAMSLPIESDEQKDKKIAAVKGIYEELHLEEEAKQEIKKLHSQAMGYIDRLNVGDEAAALLRNYASRLIGRSK